MRRNCFLHLRVASFSDRRKGLDGLSTGENLKSHSLDLADALQVLHRTWGQFESFMSAFGGMAFVSGVKIAFSTGIYSGGPAALWSSWVITSIGMNITAASLAEICSSIPLS